MMRKTAATGFIALWALNFVVRAAFLVSPVPVELGFRLGVEVRSRLVGVDLERLCFDVVD
jgi:hypothetical protein